MNSKHWLTLGVLLSIGTLVSNALAWKSPELEKESRALRSVSDPGDPFKRGLRGMKAVSLDDFSDAQSRNQNLARLPGSKENAGAAAVERFNRRLAKSGTEMRITRVQEDKIGNSHIRMMQYFNEIPVVGSDVIVHVNKENDIYLVSGNYSPYSVIQPSTLLTKNSAVAKAKEYFSSDSVQIKGGAGLVVFDSAVAYEMTVTIRQPQPQKWKIFIDAQNGTLLGKMDQLFRGAPGSSGSHVPVTGNRVVKEDGAVITIEGWHDNPGNYFLYHKNQKWGVYNLNTPDWEQRSTASWGSSDRAAISLANNFAITQNFVTEKFGRNSFDNLGAFAQANVHEGSNYVNAYWDGTDFHFGDGDNSQAGPLTTLDISAHEYGHAITEHTSNLVYSYESGALNESFSDILGTWVEFRSQPDGRSAYPHATAGCADWLCGEDCWLSGDALRDLRDPLRYSNPSYYLGTYWYTGSGDNGGVHYNSGVQNKAYYLLAEGGSGSNDGHPYNLVGMGADTAGQIAWYADMYLLTSNAQYRDARNAWIQAAVSLGYDAVRVGNAWAAVGVLPLVKHLSVSPATLAFGPVGVGISDTMVLTLGNNGADATVVSTLSFSNPVFSAATTLPLSVAGGATLPLRIVYHPTGYGPSTGILTVTSNAEDNPVISVSLSGTGVNPAIIAINPRSFYRTVAVGDSTSATLTISNNGEAALDWAIAPNDHALVPTAQTTYNASHFINPVKGTADTRVGLPVTSLHGGPDNAGYTWVDSDDPAGPVYQWNDIRTSGTLLSSVSGCDDCYQAQRLSFRFPFYGATFDTMFVSSNGFLTFGSGSSQIANYPLPSTSAPANLIDALHDDLDPSGGGDVYFKDFGNKAVVQFDNVYPYSGSGVYTFQIILEQSGAIYLYYNNLTGQLTGSTVGIQNSTRNDGLTVVYNATYLKNTLAVKFSPKSKWLTVSPLSGTISAGQSAAVQVKFNGATVAGGTYLGRLEVSHNAPATPSPQNIPCTLWVDGIRRLSATPAALNFGNQRVGVGDTASLTLSNSGDEATVVSTAPSTNPYFISITPMPLTVPAFGSTTLLVRYMPGGIGNHTGTLTVNSNAEDHPAIGISMSGSGVPAPGLSFSPQSFSKVLSAGSSVTDRLLLTNTGGDVLTYAITTEIPAASVSNPATGHRTSGNSPFDPVGSAVPEREGSLAVSYPFFDGFESGNWNSWTANSGSYTRTVTSATAASGVYSFSQTGGSSNHFDGVSAIFSSGVSPEEVSFAVRTDSAGGASGYVVFDSGGNLPFYFYLAPDGYMHANSTLVHTYEANVWYRIRMHIDWAAKTYDFYVDGTLAVSGIPFADQVSSFTTIYVYNFYSAEAWWDNFNIGGAPESNWLTLSPVSGTVATGATATIQAVFNSSNMLGGTYRTNIRIATNAPGSESVVVPCDLTVDGMRRLSITPTTYSYGSIWSGATASATFTLANGGNEATVVSSVTSSNAVFVPSGTFPLTVPPFGTATMNVVFHPVAVGTYSSNVTFASNAEDNPSVQIALSGTATSAPAARIDPRNLTFNLLPGNSPADQTSVLMNVGGAPLSYVVGGIRELSNPLATINARAAAVPTIRYDLIYNEKNYLNEFVPGRVIVAFKEGKSGLADVSLMSSAGVASVRNLAIARNPATKQIVPMKRSLALFSIKGKERSDVLAAIEALRYDANVAYVEPDFIVHATGIPNDPSFSQLYGMHNTGQSGGTVDADIDAPEAWDVHTGNGSVLIGIIDTGIDYVHPDLAANIWANPGEIPGNGIDDDGNGFVDDVHGWDFANDDSNPTDGHGHGTHCSGTIAGIGNNGVGVAGVMWSAKLVALKFLTDSGSGSTTDAIDAVNYAAAMNIGITSNSWGGGGFSQALMDAIATQDLFIAAAGNDGVNNDSSPHYPSSYTLDNIIAVAATDRNDAMASFSCYGLVSVDLGAPGVDIYSCAPGSSYQTMSGTSMATPHVSGAAGLLWTYNTMLSALEVKQILLSSTDPKSSLGGRTVSGGRLNVQKALDAAGPSWLSVAPVQAGTLAPGQQRVYTVTVDPQGLAAGAWRGAVLVNTNDPLVPQDSILVTANIAACRSLSASESALHFGNAWAGTTVTQNLLLINNCNSEVTVSALTIQGAGFSTTTTGPLVVPAFGSVIVPLRFMPSAAGNYAGVLTVASNAGDHPILTVALDGAGTLPPNISVEPLSMRHNVSTGGVESDTLFIRNTGGDNLTFTIEGAQTIGSADLSRVYPAEHFRSLEKGAADPRIGNPVMTGSGGPDAFGYRWIDSDQPGGPVYYWRDISGTGTNLSTVSGCDDCSQSVALSFPFSFYGNSFSTINVSSNGYITFGSGSTQFSNYPLPSTSMPANMISAFMDDLYPTTAGDVYFQDFGDSAYVQFNNVSLYSSTSDLLTFQMVLYRNGTMMIKYRSMIGTMTSATTGIQNGTRDVGLEIAYNTAYIHNNLAVKISPVPHWLRLARLQGTVDPGEVDTIVATFDATDVEPGQVAEILRITHNAPAGNNPVAVPCTLTVDGIRRLSVSPASYAYPPVWAGATADAVFTLRNAGNEPTTVSAVNSNNPVFGATATMPVIVPAFGSATMVVRFAPGTVGSFSGMVSIVSNAEDNPMIAVGLQGAGTAPPAISVLPGSIDAVLQTGETGIRTLSVTNTGGSDLVFSLNTNYLPGIRNITAIQSVVESMVQQSGIREHSVTIKPGSNGTSAGKAGEILTEERQIAFCKVNSDVASLGLPNVLIAGAPYASNWLQDVVDKISATGQFSSVTYINVSTTTPSLAELQLFDAVMVFWDVNYANPSALGNNLAAYVDGGGSVVATVFEVAPSRLTGRWTNDYRIMVSTGQTQGTRLTLGTVPVPSHPIMADVNRFDGGSSSYRASSITLMPGAEVVANWSNGDPLIATRTIGESRRVDLNFYPPSSTVSSDFWDAATDGARIMANALGWAAGSVSWLSVTPTSGTLSAGASMNIQVSLDATDLENGTYTANINFIHNAPGGPNPVIVPVTLVVSENGGGFVSMITGIGRSASVKAQGTLYSLTGITLGAPVSGCLRGNRYRLNLW